MHCAVWAEVILMYTCVYWYVRDCSRYVQRAYVTPAMQQVWSRAPSRHSMTTVGESPRARTPPAACRCGGNRWEIPRSGCAHPAWNDARGGIVCWCHSNRSRYFPRAYGVQGRQRVQSRSPFPRHSLTTVGESPNEVRSMKKEVCSDARNNRSAAIPAPCTGAICNFLLPTSTFILPTSMPGVRTRHGMTLGVGFWRRYCC